MAILKRKKNAESSSGIGAVSSPHSRSDGFFRLKGSLGGEKELYAELRKQVPVIDACLGKIIRLAGGFRAVSRDERFQEELDVFVKSVPIGSSGRGLNAFLDCWLDSLLTYGSALGEIVYSKDSGGISGIYTAPMRRIEISCDGGERVYRIAGTGKPIAVSHPENLLFAALSPTPDDPFGVSLLRGLPELSAILLRIYDTVGQNFDRVGNVRYAVTYKPTGDIGDRALAKERAQQIAKEWSSGMAASKAGDIRDFVAVGDVSIKAIGADNQILDTEVPVRQILEQLVAKLGIPPFLLGLNWSTSERMSEQQTDMLTSELEYYRRLVTPALEDICSAQLRLLGCPESAYIEWEDINLQDKTEEALARLRNAQAEKLERETENERKEETGLGE